MYKYNRRGAAFARVQMTITQNPKETGSQAPDSRTAQTRRSQSIIKSMESDVILFAYVIRLLIYGTLQY